MPAATQSTGAEKYTGFDERRYTMRVASCKDSASPPPDNRQQYEWRWTLEGSADPETGGPIEVRCWCSTIWGEKAENESHLVLIARALYGPAVTFEEWEALTFEDLAGRRATAMVMLNAKGYPTIDKTTFRPAGNKAAAPAAVPPVTPATPPTPPATPLHAGPPSSAPASLPSAGTTGDDAAMGDRLRQRIERLIASEGLSAEAVAKHTERAYGATDWHTLGATEAEGLMDALLAGDVAPF